MTSEFSRSVKTPALLSKECLAALQHRAIISHTPHERRAVVEDAHLLPRCHAAYSAHALLFVEGGDLLLVPPLLLGRLAEASPSLRPLASRGPFTAFEAWRFVGLALTYRYFQVVTVARAGSWKKARLISFVEPDHAARLADGEPRPSPRARRPISAPSKLSASTAGSTAPKSGDAPPPLVARESILTERRHSGSASREASIRAVRAMRYSAQPSRQRHRASMRKVSQLPGYESFLLPLLDAADDHPTTPSGGRSRGGLLASYRSE